MTKEEATSQIGLEFERAGKAAREGNDGRVRVCARRAAGIAIRFWLQEHRRLHWGTDAVNQLRSVHLDQSIPLEVRSAARRLIARVTEALLRTAATDPIQDSRIVIDHFLGESYSAPGGV
jgi:hypothetical protein